MRQGGGLIGVIGIMTFILDALSPRFGIVAGSEDERLDTIESTLSALSTRISNQNTNVMPIFDTFQNTNNVSVLI